MKTKTQRKNSINSLRRLPGLAGAIALAALAGVSSAFAASQTWTNNPVDNTWTNIGNWIGKTGVPGNTSPAAGGLSGDTATFSDITAGGIGGAGNPIFIDTNRCIKNILFDTATCGAFVFGTTASNQLWLTSGSSGGAIMMTPTVANPIVFAADAHFRLPSSQNGIYMFSNSAASPTATMTFSNLFSDTASTRPETLTLDGSNTGNNTVGPISDNTGANGAVLLVKQGTGRWILSGANDMPQKTSAGVVASVQVNWGTLEVKDPGSLGAITAANLIVQSNGVLLIDGVTLNNAGMTLRSTGTIQMNGVGTINGLVMGNTAGTSVTLTTTSASDVMTLGGSSVVSGGAADTVLHLTGPGTIAVASASTYIGRWNIDSGTNQLTTDGFGPAANVNIAAGTVLDLSPLGAVTYNYSPKGLSANGTGVAVGSTASTIKADPGATVNLQSRPIVLTFKPTTLTGDTGHPALYVASGTLSCNGNQITVNNASGSPLGAGSYQLVHQQTGNVVSSGAFVTLVTNGGLGAGLIAEIVASGGDLNMLVTAYTPKNLVWTGGNPDNTWDRQITPNWLAGAVQTNFNIYDVVNFNAAGAAYPVVNIAATMVPGSVTVDTTSANYNFTGVGQIAGGTGLVKNGTGTFTLGTANTYSGGTIISNGTVVLGADNAIPNTGLGDVAIYTPAILDLNNFSDAINALNGTGTVDLTAGGSSTLELGDNGNSGTFTGVIRNTSGTLSLFKSGNGMEVLTSSNSYSGTTTIDTGTLRVGNPYALGASAVVNNNGTLDTTTNVVVTSLGGNGGTIINSVANTTNTITVLADSTTGSLITGKLGVLVKGGTLRLNAANSYSNATIVSSGAGLAFGNVGQVGPNGVIASNNATLSMPTVNNPSPAVAANITTVDGATVTFTSASTGSSWNGQFNGSALATNVFSGGNMSIGGPYSFSNFLGTVVVTNGEVRWFNATNGGDNTTFWFTNGGGSFTRDTTIVRLGALFGNGVITMPSVSFPGNYWIGAKGIDCVYSGTFSGSNNLVKTGPAKLTFDGVTVVTNTDSATYTNYLYSDSLISYFGTTTISNGTLALVVPSTLTNSSVINLATASAVLDVSKMGYVSNQLDGTLTITNSLLVTNGIFNVLAGQSLGGFGFVKGNGVVCSGNIDPGSATAGGTLTITNGLTMLSGATNSFDLSDDVTGLVRPSDVVKVQGDVNVSGSLVAALSAINGVVRTGTYPLIKYSGALRNESGIVPTGPMPNYTLGGTFTATSRASMVLSNNPGEVDLTVLSLNSHNLIWTGDAVSNLWDVITSLSWNDSGSPGGFYQLDNVTFNDTATNYWVGLTGTLAPLTITVNTVNPATNYTFGGNGNIEGDTTIVKNGAGTLVLTNGANSFNGGVLISNGIVELGFDSGGNQNDLGLGTGPVSVNGATAQLRFGGNGGAVVNHFVTNAIVVNGGIVRAQDGVQHLTNSTVTVTAAGGTFQTSFATKNLVLDSPLLGTGTLTVSSVATGTNAVGGQTTMNNPTNTFNGTMVIANNGYLALVGAAGLSNAAAIDVQLGGILDVSGRTNVAGTLSLQSGQTLKGAGLIRGSVVALSGSTVSPGESSIAILVVTNSITLQGSTQMEINRALNPNSDRIVASNTITAGGTLTVANLGATPQAGDSFQLFNKAYTGAFAAVNLPALPTGLGWVNTLASNGKLSVINTTPTNIVSKLTGNVLTLSWPADHTGWRLLAQTNAPGVGLTTNWVTVPGSTAVNSMNFTLVGTNGSVFYRLTFP